MRNRIVFLCTGNICRSPLAEALARQMFDGSGLCFSSAGVSALNGFAASGYSISYAAQAGCGLANHRAQPVSGVLLSDTAWIIGMTRSHAAIFRSRYGDRYEGAIGLLGAPGVDLATQRNSPAVEEVDDPYGQAQDVYDLCGDQITRLLKGWTETFAAVDTTTAPADGDHAGQENAE